ncbi:MAG: 50S ribosomal protein L4 [Kiritimatiellae bacterium]|nr:50S ribosomal protein L4 [Kiritimatiellia bacterium]MCO5060940.1 50S ribosomal protein L4 [Kiritimatiellia bacterium]MCO5068145.1 50S ribosomal protein L4 [Kiritimatiellia bacterium]
MSALPVHNQQGKAVGEVQIPAALQAPARASQSLVQAVVTLRANARAGTHSTKTKGDVAGSGKKPWRQKGTGRARAGYRQSPVWTGGGVVFGPKPRSYAKAMPRQKAGLALRKALTDKLASDGVRVIDSLALAQPKTKDLVAILKGLKVESGALLVTDVTPRELLLASRNLERVAVVRASDVNPLHVLKYPFLVITREGLARLQDRLGGGREAAK